jgi:Domain of unknown function (DUF4328)
MPPQFRPLEGRAHWAKRALAIATALTVVSFVADLQQWKLVQRIAAGEATIDQVDLNESVQTAVSFAQLAAFLLAAIFFLRWFHRAYANLAPLGAAGLPHGPGWAVGYWFVPILNLVRPATVAAAIWNASGPGSPDDSRRRRRQPALVVWWWLAFLGSGFLTTAGVRMWNGAGSLAELRHAAMALLIADAFAFAAGCLAILFVRRTTTRQQERASTSPTLAVG